MRKNQPSPNQLLASPVIFLLSSLEQTPLPRIREPKTGNKSDNDDDDETCVSSSKNSNWRRNRKII